MVAAAVAAAILLATAPKAKPPPKPTYIEQVHPPSSFRDRFGSALPSEVRVRTIPIVRELEKIESAIVDPPEQMLPVPEEPPRRTRARIIRNAGLDLCRRHNMRKVMVGRYKWRCRR